MQTVQQGVLTPARLPRPSSTSAPEFHAISIPRRTYTGDFWFARTTGATLWFALGDVAGKGAQSAVWMAMIQEELEAIFSDGPAEGLAPCAVIGRIDAVLREELPPNRFATLLVGRLDGGGELTVANAGHCPLLVVRDGGTVERLEANGPAVGILPNRDWGAHRTRLLPGELLVAFSDGVAEARVEGDAELGIDRIAELVARRRGEHPRDAARQLAGYVRRITADDDVTVFAARLVHDRG
ncbi:MAG: PP2C family protein-serine/threonine phosphatase [Thermoanaerobaculia bacterium]